jgi:hypothetical protein
MADGSVHPDLESAAARVRRIIALLRELTEMAMELARALRSELDSAGASSDLVNRFCSIAQAVRRLVALEARLAQALEDAASGRWAAEEAERELRALSEAARKDAAIEVVERAVREAGDGERAERLTERLADWCSERSVERDFAERTVAEIVVGVCETLGVEPDPAVLADDTMSQTLADAVRAYAAALERAPQGAHSRHRAPASWSPPPARRMNALADPRPPPV